MKKKHHIRPAASILLQGICYLLPFMVSAQTFTLSGTITDATDDIALIGATILVNNGYGTVSDFEGHYQIALPAGSYELEYRFVGYLTEKRTITLVDDDTQNVSLSVDQGILNTVVVTGSKYEKQLGQETVSIEVIRPSLIEHSNNISIDNSIQKVPGVNVIDGQANIRGGTGYSYGAGSRVLLLMDDLPLLTADAALSNWNFVPIENIGQIEVIKGAASALYGSSAMNGIINVRTAYPTSEPETKINYFSGFYGAPADTAQQWWDTETPFFTGLNIAHRQKFGKLDLVAGGYLYANDSYLQGDYDRFGRVNTQMRYRVNDKLSVGVNSVVHLTRSVSFFFWQGLDSGLYVPADNTLTFNQGTRFSIDPFIHYYDGFGNKHKFMGRIYGSDNKTQTEQGVMSDLYYGEYQFQRNLAGVGLVLTAGLTASKGVVEAELYGDTSYVASNQAFYFQADKSFGKLNVNAGLRYEMNQLDALEEARPVLRLGSSYQLADYTFLRASWGQGYRFPTIAEKFVSTSVSIFNIFPNPDLESETGWSAELGLKQGLRISNWQAYVDAAAFMSRYFNMMEFTFDYYPETGYPFPYGFKSLNIGNTEIKGLEFSIGGTGKLGKLPLSLLAGYTYVDPIFQNFDSIADEGSTADYNVLKYRFRHVVKFDAESNFKHFRPGIEVNFNSYMEAIDQVFLSFINGLVEYIAANQKGEAVVNLRAAWVINEQAELSIICNNLLNNTYMWRPAYMEPMRNYTFKISYRF